MKIINLSLIFIFFIITFFSCVNDKNEIAEIQLKEPNSIEELGELLFFDSILSRENKVSCASCHKPEFAFSDNVKFSFGVDSMKGDRNTPSAMNMSARNFFFHDGRSESLEDQAKGPIENPKEMDIPLSAVVQKLNNHKQYKLFFNKIFKKPASIENVVAAIAAYERTLETNNSPFDNYISGKDTTLFSESAKRGQIIFNVKGRCFDCHFGPDFTNDDFKNIGIFNGKDFNDSGRYIITKNIKEIGSFKVPGLRNVAMTKPYMHNGMFNTLREVIDYYDNPNKIISNSINRDTSMNKPLGLTNQEKDDLEAFLLSLTDARFKKN
jgi:cytochrome c peroxidase